MRTARLLSRLWLGLWLFVAFAVVPLSLYSPTLLRVLARAVGLDVRRDAIFLLGFPLATAIGLAVWIPIETFGARRPGTRAEDGPRRRDA